MACFRPLQAWQRPGGGRLLFSTQGTERYLEVPCGSCVGCYMDVAMLWKVRIVHEASLYSSNLFVTLTYRPEELPEGASLRHSDFQAFMKRFRQRVKGADVVEVRAQRSKRRVLTRPVRFFMCGEYGGETGRPHFHAVLFNVRLPDLRPWRKDSFRSKTLEELWTAGHSEVALFTPGRAAYVAGYVMKKARARALHYAVDRSTGELLERVPEYRKMSQGIGGGWFLKYASDLFPDDRAVIDGKVFKVPRYYLERMKAANPALVERVKRERMKRAMELPEEESSLERRAVREELAERTLAAGVARGL